MVKLLHAAGLEVILDVVYNHTAEGGPDGRTSASAAWARCSTTAPTATAGTWTPPAAATRLNFGEPRVVQLVLDSLRYWVDEFHIDGFRFDLAVTLCRNAANEFDPPAPVPGGRRAPTRSCPASSSSPNPGTSATAAGRPAASRRGWVDWNDHFRDAVRSFWLADRAAIDAGGQGGSVARLADACPAPPACSSRRAAPGWPRSTSSPRTTVSPWPTWCPTTASTTRPTANRTATATATTAATTTALRAPPRTRTILARRAQSSRNLMASLMISQGVPMITAGDEIGRTQQGNNNAYCQDNPIAWLDWTSTPESHAMLRSTKRVIRLRKEFLAGQPHDYPARDNSPTCTGSTRTASPCPWTRWNDPRHRVVQLLLGSDDGQVAGLVVVNGSAEDVKITLPDATTTRHGTRLFELRLTTSTSTTCAKASGWRPANGTWCRQTPSTSTAPSRGGRGGPGRVGGREESGSVEGEEGVRGGAAGRRGGAGEKRRRGGRVQGERGRRGGGSHRGGREVLTKTIRLVHFSGRQEHMKIYSADTWTIEELTTRSPMPAAAAWWSRRPTPKRRCWRPSASSWIPRGRRREPGRTQRFPARLRGHHRGKRQGAGHGHLAGAGSLPRDRSFGIICEILQDAESYAGKSLAVIAVCL